MQMSYLQAARRVLAGRELAGREAAGRVPARQPGLDSTGPSPQQILQTRGWLAVRSRVLGETVLFCRDADVQAPEQYASCIRYTLDELKQLAGTAPDDLQLIHQVKRHFGGAVVSDTAGGAPAVAGCHQAAMPL